MVLNHFFGALIAICQSVWRISCCFWGVASGPFFTNGPQVSVHEFATLSMNGFDGESHPVFWPRLFLKRYTDV